MQTDLQGRGKDIVCRQRHILIGTGEVCHAKESGSKIIRHQDCEPGFSGKVGQRSRTQQYLIMHHSTGGKLFKSRGTAEGKGAAPQKQRAEGAVSCRRRATVQRVGGAG